MINDNSLELNDQLTEKYQLEFPLPVMVCGVHLIEKYQRPSLHLFT